MPQAVIGGTGAGDNILNDPQIAQKLRLAAILAEGARDKSPVIHPLQAVDRAVSGLTGGFLERQANQEVSQRQAATRDTLAQALRASNPTWTNPDTGNEAPGPLPAAVEAGQGALIAPGASVPIPGAKGGYEGLVQVLSQNPDTAGMAINLQLQQMASRQALAQELAKQRQGFELKAEFEPKIAGATELAKNAPLLARDQGKADIDLRMKPQIDAATARATAPIEIRKATAIHARNSATDVRNAGALATNREAGMLSGQLSPGPNGRPLIEAATQAREAGQQAAQAPQRAIKSAEELRKEFEGQAQVKNYREAIPAYNAIVDAASRDNKASDLNIVYGLAKIMDPTSVVREGEFKMAAAAGSPAERLQGLFNEIVGGARLTPQQRQEFIREAQGRVESYKAVHDQLGVRYEDLARQQGVQPENVVTRIGVSPGVPTPTAKPGTAGATPARPRASNAAGEIVEWDGKAWQPVK